MKSKILLIVILFVCVLLRLYKIDNPVGDWHSWRQADTAAVARNFDKFGVDMLRPRYDDLSNISSGLDNPMGWRMVEFPVYQITAYGLKQVFGTWSIEIWLRLVSIAASTGSVLLIYLLGFHMVNKRVGLLSALGFGVLPYSVYYGRVILPEATAVFLALLSIYLLIRIKNTFLAVILSGITGALVLLVKPTAAFIMLPMIYFAWKRFKGFRGIFSIWPYLLTILILTPFMWWRNWITQYPEGIPGNIWLLNGDGIRLRGAWFYWIFGERISKFILGFWGVVPLALGVLSMLSSSKLKPVLWFVAGAAIYLVIFATGNVKHDYYQVMILPALVFTVAVGIEYLIKDKKSFIERSVSYSFTTAILLLSVVLSWHEVRTYYWINNMKMVEVGKIVDELLPKDAKVIAMYGGDTAFLYQTNRQGWPIGFEIEDKIKKGATHYVSLDPLDIEPETLAEKYTTLKEGDGYIIISLTPSK